MHITHTRGYYHTVEAYLRKGTPLPYELGGTLFEITGTWGTSFKAEVKAKVDESHYQPEKK